MRVFGEHRGEPVHEATLTSTAGVSVSLISWGAVLRDWRVPDRTGQPRTVTLGFDTFEPYPLHSRAYGIIAGRVANRIREGRFTLDGTAHQVDLNWGPDSLHGGTDGFGRLLWTLEADESRARLSLVSPHGHMGYPGEARITVDVALDGHTLTFDMRGEVDRPTPLSLAQHSYYTLGAPVADHWLTVAADRVTAVDDRNVPTGALAPVADSPIDFRAPRRIGAAWIDHNFCLTANDPACVLETDHYRLALTTDQPGVQVYNAHNAPPVPVPGLDGARYGPFSGVAIEAQHWPDAVNHPHFPSVIATPDRPYRQRTSITIAPQ